MKPYSFLLSIILVVSVALVTACKPDTATKSANTSNQAEQVPVIPKKKELTPDQLAYKKLMAYSNIYYDLINGEDGFPEAYRDLTKNVLKGTVSDDIDFPVVTDLEKSLRSIQRYRASIENGFEKLDLAADELVAAGEKVLAHEKALLTYFSNDGYKTDNMEKIKAISADLEKDYEMALATLSDFGNEILQNKREIVEKRKESLKNSGDMVRYHTEEMLMLIDELLAIFDDPKVPFNRVNAFVKGNRIVEKLKIEIRAQRREVAKAKSMDSNFGPVYDGIRDGVESIIIDYRQVRDYRSQTAFESMLKKYDKLMQECNNAQV